MIPKFIELINSDNIKKYVNVNNILSVEKYSYIKGSNDSMIYFVGNNNDCFRDYRSAEDVMALINSSNEKLPLPTIQIEPTKTFPRRMLVNNGGENHSKDEYIVIADLGKDFLFRYVCVAWDNEEYFEDGSGAFNTSSFKFAEEIE
jgi:hypothetical protein